jgi:hypothetical protein
VTIETLSGPPEQRVPEAADRPDPDDGRDAAPPADPDAGRLWRGAARRAALVPLVVLAPLVALAPTADHRYNVYWHGGEIRNDPFELIRYSWVTIPLYFENGNFRPLGRMVEGALDAASFLLMDFLAMPANVALRVVSFLAAMVLTLVAVITVESIVSRGRLFASAPSTLSAAVPFAVAAGFVAAGGTSTTILFGGLYWLSAALVLAVAAVLCRAVTAQAQRVGRVRGALALLGGAALAMFNEMAYLALPLAVLAVLIRGRFVLGLDRRELLRSAGTRLAGLLCLGFLPVFVPVRVMIFMQCADGTCYRGSDLSLDGQALVALPNRMLSWLPPLMWQTATRSVDDGWVVGALPLAAAVILGFLAWRAWRDVSGLAPVDRRQALAVALAGFAVLLFGSCLAALNAEVQGRVAEGRWGEGWRDSAVTGVGGPMLVLGLLVAAVQGRRQRWGVGALVVLTALTATVSTAANKGWQTATVDNKSSILNNAIAHEIADFDRTSLGNARRCELREQYRGLYQQGISNSKDTAEYPGQRSPLGRFDATTDIATRQLYGAPFCRGGQP